jgi:hypothetical protein
MKIILKALATLFLINIVLPVVKADDLSFSHAKIPASQWEQYPEGISLALVLTRRIEAGLHINKPLIKVYIKNMSDTVINFPAHGKDYGIELYYTDSNGSKVPLHDYRQKQFFQ